MNRWIGRLCMSAAMVAATAGLSAAQDTPQQPNPPAPEESRTFAPVPRLARGQVYRYQTRQSITMQFRVDKTAYGFNSGLDVTLRYRVQEVRPDGTVTLAALFDGGQLIDVQSQVKVQEKERDDYPRTATLDRALRVLSVQDRGRARRKDGQMDWFSDVNLLVPLHFLPLPDKAVRTGDTWNVTDPVPGAGNEKRQDRGNEKPSEEKREARATLTLLGTDRLGNQETVKIKHLLTIPIEAWTDREGRATTDPKKAEGKLFGQLSYGQIAHVEPQTGLILRSEGQIQGDIRFEGVLAKMMPSDVMTIEGEFLTIRLEEAKEKDTTTGK
ncbi:MAG: hypothetical protein RMJ43_00980 [Chloroherpetonaceae bacterium]|nr:hypothetical protein [Chthonomonadaceae bacterium]MDW8206382.1 hypothetical protein [Chloroherpetonaceae bacterium]